MGEGQEGGVPAGLGTLQIPGRWGHRGTWGRTAWRVWGWLGRAASFPSLCARSSFFLPGFLRVTYLNTLINISLWPVLLHKPSAPTRAYKAVWCCAAPCCWGRCSTHTAPRAEPDGFGFGGESSLPSGVCCSLPSPLQGAQTWWGCRAWSSCGAAGRWFQRGSWHWSILTDLLSCLLPWDKPPRPLDLGRAEAVGRWQVVLIGISFLVSARRRFLTNKAQLGEPGCQAWPGWIRGACRAVVYPFPFFMSLFLFVEICTHICDVCSVEQHGFSPSPEQR